MRDRLTVIEMLRIYSNGFLENVTIEELTSIGRNTLLRLAGPLYSLKCIVAIDKDKEANIFSVARFGIVGDYKEVLPALTAKLKELKSK